MNPRGRPAPVSRAVQALTGLEIRLLARRGENVLVTLVIPVAVLLFFAGTSIIATPGARPVDFLLPGSIALAIIAAGLVNLGIATAFDRSYGVLKRLGGAPLPRWAVLAAKVAAVLLLEVVQVAVLLGVAVVMLDWSPGAGWSPALLVAAIALGTITFAGLGLLLAGALRAEAVLALANGLFLAFLMLGGIVLPVDHLPALLRPVVELLPATALADLLRAALGSAIGATLDVSRATVTLVAWGALAILAAARTFRFD